MIIFYQKFTSKMFNEKIKSSEHQNISEPKQLTKSLLSRYSTWKLYKIRHFSMKQVKLIEWIWSFMQLMFHYRSKMKRSQWWHTVHHIIKNTFHWDWAITWTDEQSSFLFIYNYICKACLLMLILTKSRQLSVGKTKYCFSWLIVVHYAAAKSDALYFGDIFFHVSALNTFLCPQSPFFCHELIFFSS